MTFNEAWAYLKERGESDDWIAAVLMDAMVDGSADLLKFHITQDPDNGYQIFEIITEDIILLA